MGFCQRLKTECFVLFEFLTVNIIFNVDNVEHGLWMTSVWYRGVFSCAAGGGHQWTCTGCGLDALPTWSNSFAMAPCIRVIKFQSGVSGQSFSLIEWMWSAHSLTPRLIPSRNLLWAAWVPVQCQWNIFHIIFTTWKPLTKSGTFRPVVCNKIYMYSS